MNEDGAGAVWKRKEGVQERKRGDGECCGHARVGGQRGDGPRAITVAETTIKESQTCKIREPMGNGEDDPTI